MTVAALLVLSACSDTAEMSARDVAVESCRHMAVSQYNLPDAGETEVRELPAGTGNAFEVTGTYEDTEWVCLWSESRSAAGTTTETTIDTR